MTAPANDNIANAAALAFNVDTSAQLGDATVEVGEVAIFDTWAGTDKSVWYEFTPTFSGMVGFDLMQTDDGDAGNPVWWLCTGSTIGDVTIVAGPFASYGVTADVTTGTSYLLRIASTDDSSLVSTIRMQRYGWGDWIDQDETDTPNGYAAGAVYAASLPSDPIEGFHPADSFPHADGTDLLPFGNEVLGIVAGVERAANDLGSDALIVTTGATPGYSGLGITARKRIETRVLYYINDPFGADQTGVQAYSFQEDMTLFMHPYVPTTYNTDPKFATQYESARATMIGATLSVHSSFYVSTDTPEWWATDCQNPTANVYAYVPAANATATADTYERILLHSIVAQWQPDGTVTFPATADSTFTLTEADLAGLSVPYGGVIIYALLEYNDPTMVGWGYGLTSHNVELALTTDNDLNSWRVRPPRYRVKDIIPVASGTFPLRRYPPNGNGGHGPTRHYPPRTNRRTPGSF